MSGAEGAERASPPKGGRRKKAREVLLAEDAKEYVFAVVGHIGSGTSTVAKKLGEVLKDAGFDVVPLRASDAIRDWARNTHRPISLRGQGRPRLQDVAEMQDVGDEMRDSDHAAVAVQLVHMIRRERAARTQAGEPVDGHAVQPDGKNRAYVLDSLRHDAEVQLLRRLYGSAFVLIGVVCEERARSQRLTEKYADGGRASVAQAMERDADDQSKKHGQKVAKAFWLSDYFVDNTPPRYIDQEENPNWKIGEQVGRLVHIITHAKLYRPLPEETAMYVAYGAARRSACLSRSVGAALLDQRGNLIAIGVNDVPRAGGGLYGSGLANPSMPKMRDNRCAYYHPGQEEGYCRNTQEQRSIIDNIIEQVPVLRAAAHDTGSKQKIQHDLQRSRIGELTEFSRAVHAEMEALLAAARSGVSTVGTRLFVTTFPCHYCARHLVSAGVDEVQYIEPYPKSRALLLHDDAIVQEVAKWIIPSQNASNPDAKVLFRPFVGVSPHLYERVFTKDREWKDKQTGLLSIQRDPDWGSPLYLGRISYLQLEAELTRKHPDLEEKKL